MTFLLMIDDSGESSEAEKVLRGKGVTFLTIKPAGLVLRSSLPVLLDGRKRYAGLKKIQDFASFFSPKGEDPQTKVTLRALETLGIEVDVSSFTARLRLQKIVYLLQQFGLETRWNFSWYIRGPYSPLLAHEMFGREKADSKTMLSERDKRSIKILQEKLNVRQASAMELEAAAAIVFIRKDKGQQLRDKAELVASVIEQKPHISTSLVSNWVEKLYPELKD